VRECRSHVEGELHPQSIRDAVMAGPLSLPGAAAYAEQEDPNPGARYVDYKTIVVVTAGEEATVAVPAAERGRASLDYDYGAGARRERRTPPVKVSDGVPVVRFVACKPGARPFVGGHPIDRETQFNGGIVTRWGRCLPLDVWPGGAERAERITISFGAGRCE
jgi:hypothetical protein